MTAPKMAARNPAPEWREKVRDREGWWAWTAPCRCEMAVFDDGVKTHRVCPAHRIADHDAEYRRYLEWVVGR